MSRRLARRTCEVSQLRTLALSPSNSTQKQFLLDQEAQYNQSVIHYREEGDCVYLSFSQSTLGTWSTRLRSPFFFLISLLTHPSLPPPPSDTPHRRGVNCRGAPTSPTHLILQVTRVCALGHTRLQRGSPPRATLWKSLRFQSYLVERFPADNQRAGIGWNGTGFGKRVGFRDAYPVKLSLNSLDFNSPGG